MDVKRFASNGEQEEGAFQQGRARQGQRWARDHRGTKMRAPSPLWGTDLSKGKHTWQGTTGCDQEGKAMLPQCRALRKIIFASVIDMAMDSDSIRLVFVDMYN